MKSKRLQDNEGQPAGTRLPWAEVLEELPLDERALRESAALMPVIAQQHDTGEVLMLAWMNRDALEETLRTGRVCYWSRSRGELWRKGERSGQVQHLVEARLDCDGDTLLVRVDQRGPACHTGRRSCFYNRIDGDAVVVAESPQIDPEALYSGASPGADGRSDGQ